MEKWKEDYETIDYIREHPDEIYKLITLREKRCKDLAANSEKYRQARDFFAIVLVLMVIFYVIKMMG